MRNGVNITQMIFPHFLAIGFQHLVEVLAAILQNALLRLANVAQILFLCTPLPWTGENISELVI